MASNSPPRAWFTKLSSWLADWGFIGSKSDTSMFVCHTNIDVLIVLVYVDDILVTGNNTNLIQKLIGALNFTFSLKDLGALNYFIEIEAFRTNDSLHLSQSKDIHDLLARVDMLDCKPLPTPLSPTIPLSLYDGVPLSDPTQYRSIAVALQHCTLTRPDIAYSVNKLCQPMHHPNASPWQAVFPYLWYFFFHQISLHIDLLYRCRLGYIH